MPTDIAAPTLEKPQFKQKQIEVLSFGAEKPIVIDDPRIKESQERIKKLKEFKTSGPDAKDVFEQMAREHESGFGKGEIDSMRLQFGGGIKQLEDGTLEFPSIVGARESHEAAGKLIDDVETFLTYADAHRKTLREGGAIDVSLRDKAMDALFNIPAFRNMFPELRDLPESERRNFIEATLASDPKLRTKVAEKMRAIQEKALALKDPQKDSELTEAEQKKSDIARAKEVATAEIQRILEEKKIPNREELARKISESIESGQSLESVMAYLQANIISQANMPALPAIESYYKAIQKYDSIPNQQKGLRVDTVGFKALEDELRRAVETIRIFESDYNNPGTNIKNQTDQYREYSKLLTTNVANGVVYTSPLVEQINILVKARREGNDVDHKITRRTAEISSQSQRQQQERIQEERKIIEDLERVLPASVGEVLLSRYDEMVTLDNLRIARDEEEAKKKGDEIVAKGINAIGKAMNEKWIHHDARTRQKRIHRDQIGTDIRRLAYQGEDGVKRLILRELRLSEKGTDGVEKPISWDSVDINSLSDENKRILNEVYQSQGDGLKTKLMADYFVARRMEDTTLFGVPLTNMALKDHELALLEQHFGPMLDEGLSQSEAAKQVVKSLEAKGIKPVAGLKWLLSFLLGSVFATQVMSKLSGNNQ